MTTIPPWANPAIVDIYGNVSCKTCGRIQSPSFKGCISCCSHNEINLNFENASESTCPSCGKNFFNETELSPYTLKRKEEKKIEKNLPRHIRRS